MSGNCDHSGFHSGVGKLSRDFQSIRFVLVCDGCGKKHEIFSRGGARRAAERFNIPYLGEIPITPSLREGGDSGVPSLVQDPRSEVSRCFLEIAAKLAGQLSIASEQAKKIQGLKIVSS